MISFENDYSELACPQIIIRMAKEAKNQYTGYGLDEISESARTKIKTAIGREDADVHFLVGGTQTNSTVIAAMLKPYEAVIAAASGHIATHEAGSVEATGHKVEIAESYDGKICPESIDFIATDRQFEHMVLPKAVYISNSTEIGTIYSKEELLKIREVCDKHGLYLFMDGARLGSALTSPQNDLTIEEIAGIVDVFYIGATKNGGMYGEAVVILNDEIKPQFRRLMKQKGALLAKGFGLGIQFDELFTDDLFFRLAENANKMAASLAAGLKEMGIEFLVDSPTNQIFPLFTKQQAASLSENFNFMLWEDKGDLSPYRLVTSWATTQKSVDAFLDAVKAVL